MNNLTKRPPYAKGTRFKRMEKKRAAENELERLIELAKEKGSERAYLDFLRTQPSALDGSFGYDPVANRKVNDPCHHRTAKYAGTSQKPEFMAIALTPTQHRLAHAHGDSVIGTPAWWRREVEKHLRRYLGLS